MKFFVWTQFLIYISFLFSILTQPIGLDSLIDSWGSILSAALLLIYSIINIFLFIYHYYLKKYTNNKVKSVNINFCIISKNICAINIIINLLYSFFTAFEIYFPLNFSYLLPIKFENYLKIYYIISPLFIIIYFISKKYSKLNKILYISTFILILYFGIISLFYIGLILYLLNF